MKCIAGIYRADGGEIWAAGRLAAFVELGVGFNPDLAARDNVLINGIMLGLTPVEARKRLDAVIEFAELEDFVDLKLKNYSSGMLVRLAFAVLVHVDADVVLIDEVLAVGDAAFQQKCIDTLRRMKDEGRTIVLVTHDMHAVTQFCDRAMLLERGDAVALGAPAQVARRYLEMNFDRERAVARSGGTEDEARFGDRTVEIVEAWCEDSSGARVGTVEQGAACAFRFRAEVRRDVDGAALGFTLSDEEHRTMFATSTIWVGQRTGPLRAGDVVELVVRPDNLLAPGRYYATPIVAYERSQQLMDMRLEYVPLLITGARASGGAVELPHELSWQLVAHGAAPAVAESRQ
jgi:ABC-type polysaccharide/polyol phosphate transport system ATPase subunit